MPERLTVEVAEKVSYDQVTAHMFLDKWIAEESGDKKFEIALVRLPDGRGGVLLV